MFATCSSPQLQFSFFHLIRPLWLSLYSTIKMRSTCVFLALAACIAPSLAAPTPVQPEAAAASQCGQWDSTVTGSYTLYQDLWGESAGTGSQCSSVTSLSGTNLAWTTSWNWSGGPYNVKSFANAVVKITSKPLSQYKSMITSWKWR